VALRTGRAGVPRFALLTGGSSRTDLTARPRRSGRTLGALRPCRTSRSRGSRQADRTSVAGGSRRSYAVSRVEEPVLGHVLAGRTDPVAVEIPAGGPGRSLTSRWARFTGGSRRSHGTVGPCQSRRPRRTRWTRLTDEALQAGLAYGTRRACGTDLTLDALRPWFARGAVLALLALRAGGSWRPLRPRWSGQGTGCDVTLERRHLGGHRSKTLFDRSLATQHLGVDGLDGVGQQQRGLVAAEEVVTVEVAVRERLLDPQRRQAGDGVGGPVVTRDVG